MKLRGVILVAFVVALINGCRHQDDPTPNADNTHGCLLQAIVSGADSTAYAYDSSGNLIGETSYSNGALEPTLTRTYTYKDGLVVSADGGLSELADIEQPNHHEVWSYEGKMVSKIESTDTYPDIDYTEHYSVSFTYTESKLTTFTKIEFNGDKIDGTFAYDNDDITTETLTYTSANGVYTSTGTNTYSVYDDMENPYRLLGEHLGHQVFLPTYFTINWGSRDVASVTKSNYQNATEQDKTYHFVYTYAFNFPTTVHSSVYINPADLNAVEAPPGYGNSSGSSQFIYSNCNQ